MRFTYTKHAERRMAQRNITASDIATLVRNCAKPRRDAEGNPIYYGTVYGWTVQVVIRKASQPPHVLTVKVTK